MFILDATAPVCKSQKHSPLRHELAQSFARNFAEALLSYTQVSDGTRQPAISNLTNTFLHKSTKENVDGSPALRLTTFFSQKQKILGDESDFTCDTLGQILFPTGRTNAPSSCGCKRKMSEPPWRRSLPSLSRMPVPPIDVITAVLFYFETVAPTSTARGDQRRVI